MGGWIWPGFMYFYEQHMYARVNVQMFNITNPKYKPSFNTFKRFLNYLIFFRKWIFWFSKDGLYWSKVTVNIFICNICSVLCLTPCQTRHLRFCYYCTSPCCVGRPCFLLPGGVYIRCPGPFWGHFHAIWSQLGLNDHPMALCSLVQFFIGDLHRLEYMKYPPNASIVESTDLVHVAISNPPAFWAVQQDWFDRDEALWRCSIA